MMIKLHYSIFLSTSLVVILMVAFSKRLDLINFGKRRYSECFDTWRYNKYNESGHLDKVSLWKEVGVQTYVFSAYLDNRDPCSTFITVFGFGKKTENPLYATLVLQHGAKVDLTSRAERTELNPYGKYTDKKLGPYSYTWPVPSEEGILNKLKFIIVEQTSVNGTAITAKIPVIFPTYSTKLFGVCVHSPLFGAIKPSTIVENIEMNKILGAERFTIYVHDVNDVVMELLQEYVTEGVAEVVQYWGVHIPKLVHYYGQTLSINECVYRNMFRVKYLVFTDLDEFIVPRRSLSWSEMMNHLENPNYGSYIFKHVFFPSIEDKKDIKFSKKIEITCGGKDVDLRWPKCFYHTYRSAKTYPSRERSKCIIKPLFIKKLGVHEVFEHFNEVFYSFVVPDSTALLHHYRSFENIPDYLQNELNEKNLLSDESALVFLRTNLYVFKKRLCRNFHKMI